MLPVESLFKILIVEDNPSEVRLMLEAFARTGMNGKAAVEYAYSAETGLDLLVKAREAGNDFDIMLLDLNMPRVSGKEMLETLRADRRFAKLIVFVFTNSDFRMDIEECRKLGADAYYQKPNDFKRLMDFFTSLNEALEASCCISIPLINKRYAELNTAA